MSHTAVIITVAYVIAVVIGSAISFAIWRSTTRPLDEDRAGTWSLRETAWLVVVALALFALLLGTIFYVPYGKTAGPDKQVVKVVSAQFGWQIDPALVRADRTVEFLLQSRDVNHGFGLYGPVDERSGDAGPLLTQVQIVPGRTGRLVWTFDKPGIYYVRCLEFCGKGHQRMDETTGGRIEVRRA
jgi:cytochrome c oxidase subunit 2